MLLLNLLFFSYNYSVLSDITGSFLLAILDGTRPANKVRRTEITTNIIAPTIGNLDKDEIPVIDFITEFIGIFKSTVTNMPNTPANNPSINVSALNTRVTSFLLAPIALKIPISFVLSITEIYVIIDIIIDETTSDILTNATLIGMKPYDNETNIKDTSVFRKDLVVTDVVYNPIKTKMILDAEKAGCKVVGGKGMLLYQGVEAFKLFMGQEMPVEEVKAKYYSDL